LLSILLVMMLMGGRPAEVETAVARSAAEGGPASVLDASGYVTARRIATVSSKITGKVKEVLIEEGQHVTEGEVLATLTGAARVALGPDLPALFCNDEAIAASYLAAGERSADRVWRMPLWRPYLCHLNSPIAHMSNGGPSRMGGAIVAALYLERFVPEGQPWVHVDTYAWNDNDRPGKPFGGEAQGLRAAFAFLRDWSGK
jgi:hypothetical protein